MRKTHIVKRLKSICKLQTYCTNRAVDVNDCADFCDHNEDADGYVLEGPKSWKESYFKNLADLIIEGDYYKSWRMKEKLDRI